MTTTFPSNSTHRGLLIGNFLVLLAGFVLAFIAYLRRNSPQIVCRGWVLLWLSAFGVSLYSICDSGFERSSENPDDPYEDYSDVLVDFFGDLGAAIFFASVIVRCWRLKTVLDINALKERSHKDSSIREEVALKTAQMRNRLTPKWMVKYILVFILVGFLTSIFSFFRAFGEAFVVLDNIFYTATASGFIIAFIIFILILRRIDDLFRQTTEMIALAVLATFAYTIDSIEYFSSLSVSDNIWLPSTLLAVNIAALCICLVFPMLLSYYSFGDSGVVSKSSKEMKSLGFYTPLLNSLEAFLHDVDGRAKFRAFLERAFALENLFFYESVADYTAVTDPNERRKLANNIVQEYFNSNSPNELNIPGLIREQVVDDVSNSSDVPLSVFDDALRHVVQSMQLDLWPRFQRSREYQSFSDRRRKAPILAPAPQRFSESQQLFLSSFFSPS